MPLEVHTVVILNPMLCEFHLNLKDEREITQESGGFVYNHPYVGQHETSFLPIFALALLAWDLSIASEPAAYLGPLNVVQARFN